MLDANLLTVFLCVVAGMTSAVGQKSTAQKPSIVHIIADDLGFNDVWDFDPSSSTVKDNKNTFTPNINRLLSEGIALTCYHTYKVYASFSFLRDLDNVTEKMQWHTLVNYIGVLNYVCQIVNFFTFKLHEFSQKVWC